MLRADGLKERRRQKRIDAIANAALELFTNEGYASTTMAAIAEAVDLTPTAVYRYFSSKQALLDYCLQARLRVDALEDDERLQQTIRSASLIEELRGRALLAFDIMASQPTIWALLVREALARDTDAVARYMRVRDIWLERLNRIIHLHPNARDLPELDARRFAAAATYMVLGTMFDVMLSAQGGAIESPLLDGPTDAHALMDDLLALIEEVQYSGRSSVPL